MKQKPEQQASDDFKANTKNHAITLVQDDGLYRFLRFRSPDTICYSFDVVTWPGHLLYTGDMGTYVFKRMSDMLTFFRGARINPPYWAEKLIAVDGNGSYGTGKVTEFDEDLFVQSVKERRLEWVRDGVLSKAQRRELWEAIEDDVLSVAAQDSERAQIAAHDFYWWPKTHALAHYPRQSFQFDFEGTHQRYTQHFLWCCHALVWAIDQYDALKAPASAELEAAA